MQTWAILVDSYRLLLSRKLFWITLVISGIVVLFYASIGFNDRGFFLLFGAFEFESQFFKAGSEWATTMYLGIFSYFIIGLWLTWAAIILALVSTTPIFNDFMADGSIDLVLSKPVGRVWVFLVKYFGSLLFVVAQVTLFALGVFLCAGWRVGVWEWKIFWAIPIVTAIFSYLYCFSVLMTILTRSTMASFLLTILLWVVIFALDRAERVLNEQRLRHAVRAEIISPENPEGYGLALGRSDRKMTGQQRKQREKQLKQLAPQAKRNKEKALEQAENLETWRSRVAFFQAFLPKTNQTTDKLDAWILDGKYSMEAIFRNEPRQQQRRAEGKKSRETNPFFESRRRMEEDYKNRSGWYVLGTSLAFEAFILGFACLLFYRRDF